MKKILQALLIIFLLNSCSNGTKKEASKETKVETKDVSKIEYPLDSLLSYDSEVALKKVYGEHVKRSVGYYPEGMGEYATTVLFPDSKNQVEFVWEDDSIHYNKLQYIRLAGKQTDWKTKEGITIGTDMKTLETLNKQPFGFFGLEWDYAGAIDWKDGYLEERNIFGSLAYPTDSMPEDFMDLHGDHTIESSSKIAQKANLILSEIIMKPSN
ncbi:hypothetical protein IMCC3317_02130 [Kordia antarctica]|uniref:Uncharacterized protein n=1 Tax=Kordia antarctica TaxID=1218801 RepID=A0A7L4ZDI5_9FLAO|nr:hypothetical protein [Kordia antarctica]QHI34868.1 hypothetical protein IMCC3317_02130 [Kordia antarctica]